jgi:hypothetical protein
VNQFQRSHLQQSDSGLQLKPQIDFGIFGSISIKLNQKYPEVADSFVQQIKSTFRVTTLYEPDLSVAFKNYMFTENFSSPSENAKVLKDFVDAFEQLKKQELYPSGHSCLDVLHEHLSVANIKSAIKYACLLKNQELEAYMANQMRLLEREREQNIDREMLDKFECTTFYGVQEGRWKIQRKQRGDYIERKKQKEQRRKTILNEKQNIEFHALLQGFRAVLK